MLRGGFVSVALLLFLAICSLSLARADWDQSISERLLRHSAASYCPLASIQKWSCKWCLSNFTYMGDFNNTETDIFGFIGYDHQYDAIMLSFRGTVGWADSIDDLATGLMVAWYDHPTARVHDGFWESYLSIKPLLIKQLKNAVHQYPNAPVMVTGHSLGAAISVLAALDIYYNTSLAAHSVYNYGGPRIGNPAFAQLYNSTDIGKATYRVINQQDVVPHVPLQLMGFHHVSREVWYNNNKYVVCDESGEDPACSDSLYAPISIADHMTYMGVSLGDGLC